MVGAMRHVKRNKFQEGVTPLLGASWVRVRVRVSDVVVVSMLGCCLCFV